MEPLLILTLYILAAIGLGYLVYWGTGKLGWEPTPRAIVAGIVFVVILLFGLSRTGVLTL